eukprot:scaffold228204_cov32-Tisochrysis_lutea.AAC.3
MEATAHLVICPHVGFPEVTIENIWPQERRPLRRGNGQIEVWETGAPAAFRCLQVDEEGEQAHAHEGIGLSILVMVRAPRGSGIAWAARVDGLCMAAEVRNMRREPDRASALVRSQQSFT